METTTLVPGDLVRLKSGSPPMVVNVVLDKDRKVERSFFMSQCPQVRHDPHYFRIKNPDAIYPVDFPEWTGSFGHKFLA